MKRNIVSDSVSYAMRQRKSWIVYPLSAHAILFGLDLSLGTELIYPYSLKQWLAQWMDNPNLYRSMFKGAKECA